MSNTTRNLVLAAAALLTVGTMSLSSNEASARGFGGFRHGGFHHTGFHSHVGFRHFGFRHFGYRHFGYRHYGFHRTFYRHYSFIHRWPARHYSSWNTYWRPRVVTGAPIVRPSYAGYSSYAAPAPVAARPSCLTKQYTPQGAVVFVDRCTQESAMNPPPETNPAAYQQGGPMPQQAESDPLPQYQGQAVPNGR